MVERRVLEDAVQECLAAGSGLPGNLFIPRKETETGAAPTETYGTYLLIEDDPLGSAYQVPDEESGEEAETVMERTVQTYTSYWSIQAFRKGAFDILRRLHLWLYSPLGKLELERRGLVLVVTSPIRDLSDLVSKVWEERAGFDLTLGYQDISPEAQDLGRIDTVVIGLRVEEPLDTRTITADRDNPPKRSSP